MKLTVLRPRPRHGLVDESNALLTVPDLAERLHITESAVHASIEQSQLPPAARIGRTPAYWLSDVAIAERDLRITATRRLLDKIRHAEPGR